MGDRPRYHESRAQREAMGCELPPQQDQERDEDTPQEASY